MRNLARWMFLLLTAFGTMVPSAWSKTILINEIMYHPAGSNILEQWIEIYNTGNSAADLEGWRLSKGVEFTFGKVIIPAGGYLVVASDGPTFAHQHSTVSNYLAGWTGSLTYSGEEIRLDDAQGRLVDSVTYANEGDWAVRRLGAMDRLNRQGWEWYAPHHGLGSSLELINPAISNNYGQNWAPSAVPGGTPGKANSAAQARTAPLVLDVAHYPPVPKSSDTVTITARLLGQNPSGSSAFVFWRVDGATNFMSTAMLDDGAHGDGLANDGIFGAVMDRHSDRTIIEFYVSARDAEGHERVYPNFVSPGNNRTANLAYQVDDSFYSGNQPVFRLIMTQAEYSYLSNQIWGGQPNSDAEVNGTFISTDDTSAAAASTQVRYNCGFRNRGHGTRTTVPHNFHIAFPGDRLWKERTGLNLNTYYTHSQQLGSAVFRRLQIPMPDSRPVQVRVNAFNLAKAGQEQFGSYAANEVVNDAFAQAQFPLDAGGNLYRGIRDMIPGISSDADLTWLGSSYSSYTNAYAKENHAILNDWSDLLQLIDAMNNTPEAEYAAVMSRLVNVDEWMKYFAVNTLLDNQENSLANGAGDDFALYRGSQDTRFVLLPYDMDSLMGRGTRTASYADGLWRMNKVAAISRFMKTPAFVPAYFKCLKQLGETAFSPAQMNPLLDHLFSSYVDAPAIANMKAFNSNHVSYVLSQLPLALTVSNSLVVSNGYLYTKASLVALHGSANGIETRSVLVDGTTSSWSAWQATWTNRDLALRPGVNRVQVQALGAQGTEVERAYVDIWYDDGTTQTVGGAITSNTTWSAANGPFLITSSLTINPGVTLTIEPGTSIYLGSGVNLAVASGGRLLAEGTELAPIRLTSPPGNTAPWGGIAINGATGTPETRLVYTLIENNGSTAIHSSGGTVFLDHLNFGSPLHQYLSLDDSSFVVSHCYFPSGSSAFELVHGTGGIKSGGRGIFLRNFFGATQGYSDVVDFTGGNRPGPIVHFIDNVFIGSSDDHLDLDGTDAWVEGNIFLHCHKNGSPDSSSAVSGGDDGDLTSEVTILGNIFYDCDQAATAKQGNFYTMINNTIVHQTIAGGLDTDGGVINFADEGTSEGAAMYLEANIIYDAEKLARNLAAAQVTFTNNLMPFAWQGRGGGNSTADPLFQHVPALAETFFTNWSQAQIMRQWLRPGPGSPALAAGPNGRDLGGVIPLGVSLAGEPPSLGNQNYATLTVGGYYAGNDLPISGWPSGSGYTHYKWRLDQGTWSQEMPAAAPLVVTNLSDGPHQVEVIGKRDSGLYQNDPVFQEDALVTLSRAWTVNAAYQSPPAKPMVQINEVLAWNSTTLTNLGATPDLIELHNTSDSAVDLSGMGLSDDATRPYQFQFPPATVLAGGDYLLLAADKLAGGPYAHTGFSLDNSGDRLYLYDRLDRGGVLIDSVTFGLQLPDFSIGRRADASWGLCQPTLGAANVAQITGNPHRLKINEWLANSQVTSASDFIEIYNRDSLPVALGGCYLSDAAGAPLRHEIAPLSFVAGTGFATFLADHNESQDPAHLNFKLSSEVGLIMLSAPDLSVIDAVNYYSPRPDASEGLSPNGAPVMETFHVPTPGGSNPGDLTSDCVVTTQTVPLLPLDALWKFNQTGDLDGVGWMQVDYDDSNWPSGPALLGAEDCNCLPAPGIQTPLTLGRTTYYFRSHFVTSTNLDGFRLNITTVVDDGAVVYLNGSPLLTNGLSGSGLSSSAHASRNVGNASAEYFSIPASSLLPGTNLLAVEVHQVNTSSSDIVWGMAIDAVKSWTNCVSDATRRVVLNEVLAAPLAVASTDSLAAPFVELYNPGANRVDLAGLSLSDEASVPRKWILPPGSILEAGSFLAVPIKGTAVSSARAADFNLHPQGGALFLFDSPSRGGNLLDTVQFGLQVPGYSIARLPEGNGPWVLALPTPGASNAPVALGASSALRINEWMADPASGSDWLEIYNSGAQPVALEGLFLTDDFANRIQSPLAPLSFVGAGLQAYALFLADGEVGLRADHVSFSLSKAGESIGLFNASGQMLDGVAYGSQQTGISQGRLPDGADVLVSFPGSASPAQGNFLPDLDDVDGDGLPDSWERAHFGSLDRNGSGDYDQDGMTDLQEYWAGTNPSNPDDLLKITSIRTGNSVTLQFQAAGDKSYTIEYSDVIPGQWRKLTDIQPASNGGLLSIIDPSGSNQARYYRIITPAQP